MLSITQIDTLHIQKEQIAATKNDHATRNIADILLGLGPWAEYCAKKMQRTCKGIRQMVLARLAPFLWAQRINTILQSLLS
jgi:hypothetical protein